MFLGHVRFKVACFQFLQSSRVAANHAIYSFLFFLWRFGRETRKDCVGKGFFGFWRFQTPPVCGCPAKEPRKNLWFLKCLGFKHGRKRAKNLENICRKGFFRLLEASRWLKTMVFTQVCAPSRHKTRKLRCFWAMYASKWRVSSSASLQEWPQTTLFTVFYFFCGGSTKKRGKIVSERVFFAFGDFKLARRGGLESPHSVLPPVPCRQGTGVRSGNWGAANWGQGTWDRELGTGTWRQGTGTGTGPRGPSRGA